MTVRAEKALVSIGLAVLLHPTFQGVAALTAKSTIPPPAWLVTPLDALPIVPAAVWFYLSWYPATAAVLLAEREKFRRAYLAYLVAFAACAGTYLLFPVTISRPAMGSMTGLSAAMLNAVYGADRPVNLFPSFHAAVAAILWRLRPAPTAASAAVSGWTVALCAACVLTRQHYALDVVVGFAVGALSLHAVDLMRFWSVSLPDSADASGAERVSAYRAGTMRG